MAKLTLEELRKLREQKRKEMNRRDPSGKTISVIIGMGTCGIAAGAKAAYDAFVEALDQAGLSTVAVKQTGCMGLCYSEPTVEVVMPGMPTVIYGKVTPDVARRIVSEHLAGKRLVDDHIYDQPAADIGRLTPAPHGHHGHTNHPAKH